MLDFIFLWSHRNIEHIGNHGVHPEEAQYVVENCQAPYPRKIEDERRIVWGKTQSGRFLQVVFVLVIAEDVRPDEFEGLHFHERVALNAGELAARIIHARDLTASEKRRLRRRKRGRR